MSAQHQGISPIHGVVAGGGPWTLARHGTRCAMFALMVLMATLVASAPAGAQAAGGALPKPGFQRDRAYFGLMPFEHIDTGSGNLVLTFTDWALPGYNGIDLVLQRTYNSAGGWTFGLAGFPMKVVRPDGPPAGSYSDPNLVPLVVTSDGASHQTWWDRHSSTPRYWTADFWRYHLQERRLELPNGIECFYDAQGALTEVRDRFANRLELTNESYGSQRYPILIR